MSETVHTATRIPADLLSVATERARALGDMTEVPVSGVIRLGLALLAGMPTSEALAQLSPRKSGYPAGSRNRQS